MDYRLGVDLGTTFTAAAVTHGGRPELVSLGDDAPEIPTVVFLREDGTLVVGEVASSRGRAAPQRVARESKRFLGSGTPVLLAGTAYHPHEVLAAVLRWVVQRVAEQEGGPADAVVVTHPASWTDYLVGRLGEVVTLAGVPEAVLRPEPVAAAMGYASLQRLAVGDVVAVYDLGGGTFDTAVVTRTADGFAVVGVPAGVEELGGVDFDEALFFHVLAALEGATDELDPDDEAVVRALRQLRQDCVTAKVRLSTDVEWTVPVGLPGLHTTVRVTRSEFEDLIRPQLAQTLTKLREALSSAGVAPEDLSRVLLAGGSSAIPLVREMLSAELGRPVALDAPPKHLVALGAALAEVALPALPPAAPARTAPGGTHDDALPQDGGPRAAALTGAAPAVARSDEPTTVGAGAVPERGTTRTGPRRRRPGAAATAGVLAVATLAVALVGLPVGGPAGAPALEVNGTPVADGTPLLDAREPDRLALTARGDVDAVWVDLLGARLAGEVDSDGTWDLGGRANLVAGALPAHVVLDGEDVRFVLDRAGAGWLSLPAAAALVLLVLLLSFGESLLGPVRRGAHASGGRLVALVLLGAGLGAVAAVAGWIAGPAVLTVPQVAACAVLGAAAVACGLRASLRGDDPGEGPGATPRWAAHPPVPRGGGTDVPRGASTDPDSR